MSRSYKTENRRATREWRGPEARFDLLKEATIATIVVVVVVVILAVLFSGPRATGVTFQSWSKNDPSDFASTTLSELLGTSGSATYGPPYNDADGSIQGLGPISFQKWGGIHTPVDPPQDFVLGPLTAWSVLNPDIKSAVATWQNAGEQQQKTWSDAAQNAQVNVDGTTVTLTGEDTGPITTILTGMMTMAQSGALDTQMVDLPGEFYSTNHTKSLLYLADGEYLGNIAEQYHQQGDQWGVMNEVGSWPGQPWLSVYALLYQIPPWKNVGTDIIVIVTVIPLFLILLFLPFIPGLRSLPRRLGVYRLIWRSYYRDYGMDKSRKETEHEEDS